MTPPARKLSRTPALVPFLILTAACGGDGGGGSTPTEPPAGPTNQPPVATFTASVTTGTAPLAVVFDASASSDPEGTALTYAWSFGDGTSAGDAVVIHVFDGPGSYTVRLTVTDSLGARDTASRSVEATAPAADEIFGVVWFDRNGDGARNAGETGAERIPVYVDLNRNGKPDAGEPTATTDVGGVYRFPGLAAGSYRVSQDLPVGWTNTVPGPGAPSTAARTPTAIRAPLAAGPGPRLIIDGDTAAPGAFPFQVSLQIASVNNRTNAHFCGGTLVAPGWVLTAGHCLTPFGGPTDIEVLLGTSNLEEGGQRVAARRLLVHPFYVPGAGSFKRDMGLIELDRRFPGIPRAFLVGPELYDTLVRPFTLASVIGWGRTQEGVTTSIPEELQVVEIPVLADSECETRYGSVFDQTMICAGFLAGGKSSCQGDSGGPLLLPYRESWYEDGIVSWGVGCGAPERPGVYARVAAMIDFIRDNVAPEPSGSFDVTLSGAAVRVDFGNFH